MSGASLADMRPGSAWLAALAQPVDDEQAVPTVSIWSWHDSMVAPQDFVAPAYGENIVLGEVAHNAMLGDPRRATRSSPIEIAQSACA